MRRKIYRIVTVATIVTCVILVLFTWYVVGIVKKNNTKKILEMRVSGVCDTLYRKDAVYSGISSEITDEYRSKARALAIVLSKNAEILNDELQLEEMRMACGANSISIYNDNAILEYSTDDESISDKLVDKFKPAITDKLFSLAQVDVKGETIKIIVGCSRLDCSGIVVAEYIYGNSDSLASASDISDMLINIPVMETGSLGVINSKSMKYTTHTDKEKIGKASSFSLDDDFLGKSDYFDCIINGKEVLLHFDFCNDRVVLGYVPYSEIYRIRNDTIKWVVAAGIIIAVVVTLTFRSVILHINKKEKKK